MSNKVYQIVTDQIIELLKQGTVPWRASWNGNRVAINAISNRAYSGINPFILNQAALKNEYTDNRWLTFRQAQKLGGHVKKGEKAITVVFWKPVEIRAENTENGDGVATIREVPVLRYYNLFNVSQCENLAIEPVETTRRSDLNPSVQAESIVTLMPNPPKIAKGLKACYNYRLDTVTIPPVHLFDNIAGYYSTLFHELVHSTRHATRTGRDTTIPKGQHDERYSKEELIAEMGAAMLCGTVGIENQTIQSSAAYIQHWLENLQNDSRMVIRAASKAQKAVDFILGLAGERASITNHREAGSNQVHATGRPSRNP